LNFVLRKLDPSTGCWLQQCQFAVSDLSELRNTVSVPLPELLSSEEIGKEDYSNIVKKFKLSIDENAQVAELEQLADGFKIDQNSHTGRELLLMLEGRKPLAAFVEVSPDDSFKDVIPEKMFSLYVREQKLKVFEYKTALKGSKASCLRRVLYALPGQEWRFYAHEMLWRTVDKYGWNDSFEKIEGFLLGYETETDTWVCK
jgi:hypothetical protein